MGPRYVLLAEDERIAAADLRDTFEEAGFIVEGPHFDVSSAMLAFQKHKPDLAILSVKLGDGLVGTLAERLADEQVPIIFHSRPLPNRIAARFPRAATMANPSPPAQMIAAVNQLLSAD